MMKKGYSIDALARLIESMSGESGINVNITDNRIVISNEQATTEQTGAVQLSDLVDGDSVEKAATENAVRKAYLAAITGFYIEPLDDSTTNESVELALNSRDSIHVWVDGRASVFLPYYIANRSEQVLYYDGSTDSSVSVRLNTQTNVLAITRKGSDAEGRRIIVFRAFRSGSSAEMQDV